MRTITQPTAITNGASRKSCTRSAPITHRRRSAGRVPASMSTPRIPNAITAPPIARPTQNATPRRSSAVVVVHRTTSSVTHLVWLTPGRFGAMSRIG